MCRVVECGLDTGDCGTDDYNQLYGVMLSHDQHYIVPLGEPHPFLLYMTQPHPHRGQSYVL